MTFVGGFNCADGLVMFSDSLEDDGFVKKHVNKLRILERGSIGNEWGVCVAGSGEAAVINKLFDILVDLLPDDGQDLDRVNLELHIESVITHALNKYQPDGLQFVIGLFSRNPDVSRLYKTDGSCLTPQDYMCFVGQDSTLVNFFADTLADPVGTVDEAVGLGWLLTDLMAKHGHGVEGPVRIATVRHRAHKWKMYDPGQIASISKKIGNAQLEWLIWNWWEKLNSTQSTDEIIAENHSDSGSKERH